MAADGYLQFSSYQEPVSRRENRRSSICNQSFVTDQIEKRRSIREVHGPPDVADGLAERSHEILHGH